MSKIEPRLNIPAVAPSAPAERTATTPQAASRGDRLTVSASAKTAEQMRAFIREVDALFEFEPRTTQQAKDWVARGQALHADAAPRLKNGDLRSLPLKERQLFTIALGRLEHFLEDGPDLVRFFEGE